VTVEIKTVRHWNDSRQGKLIWFQIRPHISHLIEPSSYRSRGVDQRVKAVATVSNQYLATPPPGHLESACPLASIDTARKAQPNANTPGRPINRELLLE
jgi:hypothetical protein